MNTDKVIYVGNLYVEVGCQIVKHKKNKSGLGAS